MRSVLLAGGDGPLATPSARAFAAASWQVVMLEPDDRAWAARTGPVQRVDCAVILADAPRAPDPAASLLGALDARVARFRELLETCREAGTPAVVVVCPEQPAPRDAWAAAREAERQMAVASALAMAPAGLCVTVLRCAGLYGPCVDGPGGETLLSVWLDALASGRPPGPPPAVARWCYVDDAAGAVVAVAARLEPGAALAGRVLGVVGWDAGAAFDALAGEREVPGVSPAVGPEAAAVIGAAATGPDSLEGLAGFRPEVALEAGLRETRLAWVEPGPPNVGARLQPPPVPVVRPHFAAIGDILRGVEGALRSGIVTNGGPVLRRFEASLADALHVEEVVATASGADALTLGLLALGLRGRVVLPSYTYIATLNAVVAAGLEPVFCDIAPGRLTLCPDALEAVLRTGPAAAVIPVNVFGVPPDLARIASLARAAGARVVYDNAHGVGTTVAGSPRHGPADVETLSFHATKTLPAVEGGAVIASDPGVRAEVRRLLNHGLAPDPLASRPGFNAKLDELRATVGLASLADLDASIGRRRAYAVRLRAAMVAGGDLRPQEVPPGVQSNFQNLAGLTAPGRSTLDGLMARLAAGGVASRRYFAFPLHRLRALGPQPALPVTEHVVEHLLCVPLHARMSEPDLRRIEAALRAPPGEAP